MWQRFDHRLGHYSLLLAVGSVLFLLRLGQPSLWDLDEGRNAMCSFEMMETANWIRPTFNGTLRVDKPVLLYWLQIASYHLLGVDEFGARFPSALAALATLLLVYELGRRMFDAATGLLAGLVWSSTVMVSMAARFANPDALLNLFSCLTLLLFWRGWSDVHGKHYAGLGIGIATGFAVLAKGPVGLVLPVAIIGLFLLWQRQLPLMWRKQHFWGIPAFCLVALPWYIAVAVDTNGAFLQGFLLKHNVDRFVSTMENHSGGPWYYPVVIVLGSGLWSCFLGTALWYGFWPLFPTIRWPRWQRSWEAARESAEPQGHERYRFLWCWIGIYLLFFTVSATKLPNYVLPLAVPFALLPARFFVRWQRGTIAPPPWMIQTAVAGLLVAGLGMGVAMLIIGGFVTLPFGRVNVLTGMEPLALLGLLPLAAAFLVWYYWRRQRVDGVLVTCTVASIVFVAGLATWGCALLNAYKAPRALVETAAVRQPDRDMRIGCYRLPHLPSLHFYSRRTVAYFNQPREAANFLEYEMPVYLFLTSAMWAELAQGIDTPHRIVGRHLDLYSGKEIVVVTNQ